MKVNIMTLRQDRGLLSLFLIGSMWLLSGVPLIGQPSQAAVEDIHVVTFPTDRTIDIPLISDPKFPGTGGRSRVDLDERGVASIKTEVRNIKFVLDIGGLYSTYVLWAVLADGSTQRLGPLETSSVDPTSDAKLNVDVALNTFGLLITAEPHHMVRIPSHSVVLRSGLATGEDGKASASKTVQCVFSENDYSRTREKFDKKKEKEYRKTPLALVGAQNAVYLAKDAGAETDATDLYNEAIGSLEKVENSWRSNAKPKEIEMLANRTIGMAAEAEKRAIESKRERRETQEKNRSKSILEQTQEDLKKTEEERDKLKEELAKVTDERDRVRANFQDKMSQSNRLERENADLREEAKKTQVDLIRLMLQTERLQALQDSKTFGSELAEWERFLSGFGKVKRNGQAFTVTLPETLWLQPDSAKINLAEIAALEPFFKKLADTKFLRVTVVSSAPASDDLTQTPVFVETRAKMIADQIIKNGVGVDRISSKTQTVKPAKKAGPAAPSSLEIVLGLIS